MESDKWKDLKLKRQGLVGSVKKEKVAYVDTNDSDQEFDFEWNAVEENKINVAELKPGPPYTCKVLKPSNGKKIPRNLKMINMHLKHIHLMLPKLMKSSIF